MLIENSGIKYYWYYELSKDFYDYVLDLFTLPFFRYVYCVGWIVLIVTIAHISIFRSYVFSFSIHTINIEVLETLFSHSKYMHLYYFHWVWSKKIVYFLHVFLFITKKYAIFYTSSILYH